MLDRWSKIATIALAIVLVVSAIIAPSIGGVVWLSRLDYEVKSLRSDVEQLQSEVKQLQEGQQIIINILQTIADNMAATKSGLASHTHNPDGRAQFYIDSLNKLSGK